MKLMQVTALTAIRNDKQIIHRWEEREVWMNPRNIESISFIGEINKAQILLTSGRACPVAQSLQELANLFEEATCE